MRLWHYKLISVLPKAQLVSQWRECIAIMRQWKKGTLNHGLVKYVMNYNKELFTFYTYEIISEFNKRGYKYNKELFEEVKKFSFNDSTSMKHYPEHNDRYLIQCYYNLQEKYDRGLISKEEWTKIKEFVNINYIAINNKNYYEI